MRAQNATLAELPPGFVAAKTRGGAPRPTAVAGLPPSAAGRGPPRPSPVTKLCRNCRQVGAMSVGSKQLSQRYLYLEPTNFASLRWRWLVAIPHRPGKLIVFVDKKQLERKQAS